MTDRETLISLPMEDLEREVKRRSRRLSAAGRGYKIGQVAYMEVEQCRREFYLARGICEKLKRDGAI